MNKNKKEETNVKQEKRHFDEEEGEDEEEEDSGAEEEETEMKVEQTQVNISKEYLYEPFESDRRKKKTNRINPTTIKRCKRRSIA